VVRSARDGRRPGRAVTTAAPHEDFLRRLALNDEVALEATIGVALRDDSATELGQRTSALLRLAALVATDGSAASYQWAVQTALAAGASEDEIVAVLATVGPIVGAARLNAAAAELAPALGLDFEIPRRS
jgi:alkylhydroperoxidase/carboxymuconolactone decarboxylase family protein YurZ